MIYVIDPQTTGGMDPAVFDRWVAALESGAFRQIEGCLYTPPVEGSAGHCCLGVLAEVCGLPDLVPHMWREVTELSNAYVELPIDELRGTTLREALGLSRELEAELVDLNDRKRKSFPQIAKWLREHRQWIVAENKG